MEFIDLKTQYKHYKAEIDSAIQKVLDHGAYILGPEVKELEQQLARYVGVKHCLAVASGTDALLIPLMAYGIGPGDEVITVPFTWISTAEVIALIGAKPVFVDIDPDTYNIDISQIEAAITPRTKAIMPVSLFGQMPDYDAINAIAAKYGIPVIEDGAQSFGATRNGRQSCGVTHVGATSFYPAKSLGCYGDGGAVFTNDDVMASSMRAIHTHGAEVRHHHTHIGINGRFDTLQAAIVLVKLKHFNEELRLRQKIGQRYSQKLKDSCIVPVVAKGNVHSYAYYTIRVTDRDAFGNSLKEAGIPTSIFYPKSVHEQPCFAYLGYTKGSFPVSEKACKEVISLPMHPWLTEEQQDLICEKVIEFASVPVA